LISIVHYLYRKRVGFATLALLAFIPYILLAQSRKKDTGPRALAVVELPADGKSKPRLIPLAILVNGRFWDAAIYRADPRPLALDPGNVYEAERSGKPVGFFTVSDARPTQGGWIAFGDWQPQSEKAPPSSQPGGAEDDDRPVLRKSSPSAREATPPATAPAVPPSDDPNRPVLRRGRPKTQSHDTPEEGLEKPSASTSPTAQPAAPVQVAEVLPAISDAGGPEPRPYTYTWAPDQQQRLTKAISEIASAEVARHARNTPALRFAPAASFDQVAIRAFDLQYENNPEVVFTARVPAIASPTRPPPHSPQPAPEFFFYVTVVGQPDPYGHMRKLFSSVTDSAHLDAVPRLELIDAVDAEGTGRGDLLFRAWAGGNASYQLYHVGPDSLRKLIDTAGPN
jgi:hypothetical protein